MKPHRREATPVAHMILSQRMADHKPHDMICELVDNAFDADAKRVWIELGRRSISAGDDGSGMEDVNDAVRFGKGTRAGQRGGVLGRYGVGMTDALCKLGPRAEIATLRSGGVRRLRVDWEECLRNDHFPYLDEGKSWRSPLSATRFAPSPSCGFGSRRGAGSPAVTPEDRQGWAIHLVWRLQTIMII